MLKNRANQPKIFIIVPAYNEEKTVKSVISELCEIGYSVLMIDDGSHDKTYSIGKSIQKKYPQQVLIYQHIINRGLGAALKTGMEAAAINGADIMVTFDADGQHDIGDIENICKPLIDGDADVVIGKRNFKEMPLSRNIGNYIMNIITLIFYGIYVNDSQSGLRGFSVSSTKILELHSRGYGVSSEIIKEIKKNKLKLKEVPIKTIYNDYALSKGTNTSVGLKILFKMILDIIKRV